MAGQRYIKGKDGKLAGSVPDPSALNAPTASDVPQRTATAVESYAPITPVNDLYSAFQAKVSGQAADRSWADKVKFPTLNAVWTDQSVVLVDTEYSDEDFNMGGGRLRSGMTVTEIARGAFRAFPAGEPITDPDNSRMNIQYYRIPSYNDPDGTTLAVKAHYGGPVANYDLGTLNAEGEWTSLGSRKQWLRDHIGENGDPFLNYVDGDIDDWGYGLMTGGSTGRELGKVDGILISVTTEPREIDPEDLADQYEPSYSYYDD